MPIDDDLTACLTDDDWDLALACAAARRAGRPAGAAAERTALALYRPLLAPPAGARPWVIAQLGQSLDGCVATHRGDSAYVTGEASLVHLHRLRALCDAVIVGAGTVAADDPQLTTRRVRGPNPVRVVLDPRGRLQARERLFHDAAAPTLRLVDAGHRAPAAGAGEELLAVQGLADADGRLRPRAAIDALAARGLRLLFVEGGGVTVSRFLAEGCLDRLHLTIAPVLIGGGRRGLDWPGPPALAACPRPPARAHRLGDDLLWDLDLAAAG